MHLLPRKFTSYIVTWHVEVLYQFKASVQFNSGKTSFPKNLKVFRIKFLCNIVGSGLIHNINITLLDTIDQ